MNPRWIFDEHEMGRKERNPVNEEFFANNTPLAAIIREGIQNSLDAADGSADSEGNPLLVRVRLYFSGFGPSALAGSVYSKYRANAEEHYRMPKNGLPSGIPDESDPCPFFVIEDFRTTGLTGDTFAKPPDGCKKKEKNYYNYFFRENLTDKGDNGSLGSWGAGKAVFQRASRLKTSFAYTVRESGTPRAFLAGTVTLQVREDGEGRTWDPDGWFGIELKKDPDNPKKLLKQPIPCDHALARDFLRDFRLERGDEPGTSIVVPYVAGDEEDVSRDDAATLDEMVRVALAHFLPAVLRGMLVVDVSCGAEPVFRLDAAMASAAAVRLGDGTGEVKGATALHEAIVRDAVSPAFPPERRFRLYERDPGHEWGEGLFPEGCLPAVREAVRSGETVVFEVPISVQTKSGRPVFDYFLVALRKTRTGKSYRPLFYRGGLLIDDVTARVPADIVSAVLVERHPERAGLLVSMLTAAEPPSHSEWLPRLQRLADGYRNGKKKIDFIRSSVAAILEIIEKSNADPEWDALADVFSIVRPGTPDTPAPETPKKPIPECGGQPPSPEPPPEHTPSRLLVEPVSAGRRHGFRIRSNPESAEPPRAGYSFAVRVFYNTLGSPDWKPSDFLLSDEDSFSIGVEPADAAQVSPAGNRLAVRLLRDGPFSVTVRGFDGARDIVVSVPEAERGDSGQSSEEEA
jgi:hypothetical protein